VGIALVEMALRSNIGLRFWAPDNVDPFTFLFSESAGRALVVIARSEEVRFSEMCAARQVTAARIGVVDSGLAAEHKLAVGTQVVEMTGQFAVSLEELRAAHVSALPQVVA
jgi:phosphoribosylformylglycinamidine synthase